MLLIKLLGICSLISSVMCNISGPMLRMLSPVEIAEINKIAEESVLREMENAMADEVSPIFVEQPPPDSPEFVERPPPESPEFVEQPPPDAGTYEEIESIRKNISNSGNVECNITAGYLWELCRPVLLRTCKDQFRRRCRTNSRRFHTFNRRLHRTFPIFRPPEIFNPLPLGEWFENQISRLNGAIKNSTNGIQFSISITNNNKTTTFTHEDAAEEIENITEQFHASLNNVLGKYSHLLRNPEFPAGRMFRRTRGRHADNFGDWLHRFLSRMSRPEEEDDEDEEDEEEYEDEEDEKPEEVPATRIRESSKSRNFDPSVMLPKRLPKRKKALRRKSRQRRSPHRGYSGRSRTLYGPLVRYAQAHTPQRNRHMGMMNDFHKRFMERHHGMPHISPWHHNAMPMPRIPSYLPQRFSPPPRYPEIPRYGMKWPTWDQSDRRMPKFPWGRGREEEDDEPVIEVGITCEQMEESPEVCLEITERTKKCEAELTKVCPEYMEARRRISEKLDEVISRQHQITHVVRGDDEEDDREVDERYQWATQLLGKPSIVIESIRVNQRGSHEAYVTARLSDDSEVEMVVPGSDYDLSAKSLGKAIGKMAFNSYKQRNSRREP